MDPRERRGSDRLGERAGVIGQETPLTLAGFIALLAVGLATLSFVIAQMRRAADDREAIYERIVKLEAKVDHHIENGLRHQKPPASKGGTR